MTATDLESLIQELNAQMFEESFGQIPGPGKADKWFDQFPGNNSPLRLQPSQNGSPLRDNLMALIRNDTGKYQAVGHVIDEETNGSDFPVILVIGINYYQFSSGPMEDVGIWNNTIMRGNANAFLNSVGFALEKQFRLVAANIFPWTTTKKWQSLQLKNNYQTMALLELFGYKDPILSIRTLAGSLKDLKAIIFHGVQSAVPFYAASFARQWVGENRVRVFLSDSLSLPAYWKNICIFN